MCRPTVNWALENCKFRRLSHFLSACLHFPLHHHRLLRARITWKTWDAKKWSSSFPGHRVRTRKEPRAVETRSLLDEECGNFAVRPAHAAARVKRGEVLTQPVIRPNMLQGAHLAQSCHCFNPIVLGGGQICPHHRIFGYTRVCMRTHVLIFCDFSSF